MSKVIFEKKWDFGIFQTWNDKPPFDTFHVHQVHGIDFNSEMDFSEADGICGKQTMPWSIKTADCLPILIMGQQGHVFMHAGWRGLANKIHLQPEVEKIAPQFVFIGPHICADHFEVSADFTENFPNSNNFKVQNDGKYSFDLLGQLIDDLKASYPSITIEDSKLCTFEESDLHSFRLDKTQKRNWNVFTYFK